MKKLLILSIFPAPYRVEVFRELRKSYQVDLFFEVVRNQDRNQDWFVDSDEFRVLDTAENRGAYRDCLKRLKSYDMVLAYDYFSKRANGLMLLCMAAGVPYAINCDGAFISDAPLKTAVKRLFVSHAALCFASGSFARNYFLHYGAKARRIHIHHFTSLSEGDYLDRPLDREEKNRLRRELGLDGQKTVLSVGQFIHRKGYDILLRAWKESGLDVSCGLVIVGGGGLKQRYLEYIKKNHLRHVYVLDFMEKDRLVKLYRQADLFVLPTREDVWGLVVNEAMANALPVITTDRCIAGMELVREGVNGFVVPTENPAALAGKMREVLSEPGLAERMGAEGLKSVRGKTMEAIGKSHARDIGDYLAQCHSVEVKSSLPRGKADIYVVTASHNRIAITERFVDCLNRQTCKGIHLVLVDDGCTDGTPEMVRQKMKNYTIIHGNGDLWWGGGLHQAYLWVKKNVGNTDTPVLINNDDVQYGDDYIERGIRLLKENPGTLVVGNGYGQRSGEHLDGVFYHNFQDGTGHLMAPGKKSNCASTRSLFLTVGDWMRIGGMHPHLLPHYASDFEFTIRGWRKGLEIRSFPSLNCTFDEGATGENDYGRLTLKKMFSKCSGCNPFFRLSFVLLSTPPKYLPAHLANQIGRYAGKLGIFRKILCRKAL